MNYTINTMTAVFGQVEAQSINAKQMSVIETKEEFFTYIKKFVDELLYCSKHEIATELFLYGGC